MMRHTFTAIVGVVWGGAIVGRTIAEDGLAAAGPYGDGSRVGFAIGLIMLFAGLATLKNAADRVEPVYPNGATSLVIIALATCLTFAGIRLAGPNQHQVCETSMVHFLDLVDAEYGPDGVADYNLADLIETCAHQHSTRWAQCVIDAATVDDAVDCR